MSVKSGNKHKNRNAAALSALAAGLLAAYIAPASAANIDFGTDGVPTTSATSGLDQITVSGSNLKVGSTSTNLVSASGSGSPGDPPYIVNNGDGTSTVYTVTNIDASTTATNSVTGGVLLEENGNITGNGGATTTTITTYDLATSFLVVNSTGLPIVGTTVTGIVGDYTNGTFTPNVTQVSTTVASNAGGNLVMSGNGTFGGDLYVAGTIYGNGTDGALTLHGGTSSTSITIDNNGVAIADSTNGATFSVSNTGNVTIGAGNNGNLDMTGGNISNVGSITATNGTFTTVNATQLNATNANITGTATIGTLNVTGSAAIQGNLDMTNGNISNVNTITATTGNITTVNSTTINNSGTVTTSDLQATTASIGDLDFFDNVIGTNDDLILRTNTDNGSYGALIIEKQDYSELARFDDNGSGGTVIQTNTTVQGTTTLNGATTVNNSFTVDTNGGSANVTGTGRVVVQTNSASFGVQNAGGNLNGITANTTGTVVRGGTNSSTLTLQQDSAVLSSGADSSVALNSGYAEVYGGYETWVGNDYGSNTWTEGYSAGITSQADTYVIGGNSVQLGGGTSSLVLNDDGATFSGEGGSPIRVHGVAAGKAKTDAVNVGQLQGLREELSGGIASTIAMSNIPHVDESKTFAVGIGYGNYDGESGYALGGSYRFMGSGVLKATVAGSDSGETAWGVGAGMSW